MLQRLFKYRRPLTGSFKRRYATSAAFVQKRPNFIYPEEKVVNRRTIPERRLLGGIFDGGGTIEDSGVYAPTVSFQKVFADEGVKISIDEARKPMGNYKKVHIRKITEMKDVRKRWVEIKGKEPTEKDVERMFKRFIPTQLEMLKDPKYTQLIPQAGSTLLYLRNIMGLKLGLTTGYTRRMLNIMLSRLESHENLVFDVTVSADEVKRPRPYPDGCIKNMEEMGIKDPSYVFKAGDTEADIEEGREAKMWTIGLSKHSSLMGMNLEELYECEMERPGEYEDRLCKAKTQLKEAGAHYVIDDLSEIIPTLVELNWRIALGERA